MLPFKRLFDLFTAVILLVLLSIPMVLIFILIRATSNGSAVYWSDRIGKGNKIFKMPKFRSMKIGSPIVATHLIKDVDLYLTPIGKFLRRFSLDELPQLYSILKGDMSFVGPRPALYNQDDLVLLRREKCVDNLVPGLTGWAQINGRDNITISEKVKLDVEYLELKSFWFDLKILKATLTKSINNDGISH